MRRRFIVFLMCLLLVSSCEMKPLQVRQPLVGEGEVFLYAEPPTKGAETPGFFIGGVSARRADGAAISLALSAGDIKPGEVKRQRLVASGRLPSGSYSGLSLAVRGASVGVKEGERNLAAPKEALTIDFPFTVRERKALVLSMTPGRSRSSGESPGIAPSFSLSIPGRPLLALNGFVSNRESNTVSVFDKRAGRVASVIETGNGPAGIALDQRAKRAYVALSEDDSIEIIDVERGDIINRLRLNTGDRFSELALTPDGSTLITVNYGSDSVSFVNPVTLFEIKRIAVGDGPSSILFDRTGRKALVFNSLSNTISVVDVPNKAVAATISTEQGPLRGQFNRRGDRLFVFFERSPYLLVFDPSTFSVVKRVLVGTGVSALKVDVNTDMLYLARRHDGAIEVYDPFSLMPVETFNVGGGVGYMTIDNEGNTLCAALPDRERLVIVDLVSKQIVSEMDVGDQPFWAAMMGER